MVLSITSDILTQEGFVPGLMVLGAVCVLVWEKVRTRVVMAASVLCVLSAYAAPPEKTADKAMPVADEKPKITPQEAKKETPKERYIRLVCAQVEKKWRVIIRLHPEAQSPGRLAVDFYVNTEGKLDDMRIVDDTQTYLSLTEATVRAIMEAEIPPMPAEVIPSLPMNDPKRLKIQYCALISYSEPKSSKGETKSAMKGDKTAKGRYYRQVVGQVEKKWNAYRQQRMKDVSAGSLKAEFYVNKKGKVESLKVLNDKDSNPLLTEITLQAIKDAEIPPMPAEVIPLLPKDEPERLKIEYDALID